MGKKTPDAFIITKDDGDWDLVSNSVLSRYALKSDTSHDESKQIQGDGWDYEEFYEPLYDPESLLELLEVNTYHAQCVDVVARESSDNGWTIQHLPEQEGSEHEKDQIREFVKGLTPNLNNLLYQRTYDRRAMGYGALEVIREGRSKTPITGLDHIAAQHLRRHRDGFRVKQQIGMETVWFVIYGRNKVEGKLVDVHKDTGEIHPYNRLKPDERANELLWQMDYTPKSKYYGLAKIVPAIPAIHGDTSRATYNNAFFKNYGMPAFAVTISGDFEDYDRTPDDPEYDVTQTLRYKISQQIKDVMKNPHSAVTILVPSEGEEGNVEIKLQPLSIDTKEAGFQVYRKDNRDEVISAHRVPPYRIGINETGKLGGDNSESSTKIYKNSILEPIQGEDENDIQMLIEEMFPNPDWYFKLNEIDVFDLLNDLRVAETLLRNASMTPGEMRRYFGERFGLESVDNSYLDEFYLNNTPLEHIWNQEAMIDPPGTDTVLNGLEDELADIIDDDGDGVNDETRDETKDSKEGASRKNAFNRLTERIRDAVTSRKSTK